MSEIKTDVNELCEAIKDGANYGDGVVDIPKEIFENSVTDAGLDIKQWQAMNKHRDVLISATTKAVAEIGLDQMKKDKSLDQVSGNLNCGKDKIGVVVHRKKEVNDGKGGKLMKYGSTRTKFEANGASGQKGELKKVRSKIEEDAVKMFG
jgi:hypothetical protein